MTSCRTSRQRKAVPVKPGRPWSVISLFSAAGHGAVWITYRNGLDAGQVDRLAAKVRGTEYVMLSPVDNLDAPISLQAWRYRLTVPDATDERIRDFIATARINAALEPSAPCSAGITATGTAPRELPANQQQIPQGG